METWKIIEIIFNKEIEKIIDVATGKWICGTCKDKKKYFSKEAVLEAAKEKHSHK